MITHNHIQHYQYLKNNQKWVYGIKKVIKKIVLLFIKFQNRIRVKIKIKVKIKTKIKTLIEIEELMKTINKIYMLNIKIVYVNDY
jgi:hypothetical protein